ncbi:type II toxin-antitoxin system VapC family toxin [Solicola gregarius]|uniref:Ribonuclease VapC n=1 Tax=Solicola gregarius TaxID=2908642 RepID=A0AA46TGF3_9ACTN|nr:type II toxin-antitoxin system VapC family toxin [Solicola gregarius]UYM04685.1 type II toxin-antitoxin system VapC family toxin [Solicola gregarius]
MIVVDASALIELLVYEGSRGQRARDVLSRDEVWCAPEHWKAEVFSAVRGLMLGGQLGEVYASRAITRLPMLAVEGVDLNGLLNGMWQLRHEVSGYDAAYVALAQQRRLTLVTADAHLARAAVRHCRVESLE